MSVKSILQATQKIKHTQPIYLVGGIVRDMLLKRETKDIDFVTVNAEKFAKKFAQTLGGSFFILDDENKIYRVVLKENYFTDFAHMRGGDIENDLKLRDFTVDAMAIRIDNSKKLIDPFEGQEDLKNKTIRMVGQNIFEEDPLRLLRAFRLAATLDFEIETNTLKLISRQSRLIKKVAPERVREELTKILSCPRGYLTFNQMDKNNLLEILLPEIKKMKNTAQDFYGDDGVWHHTLSGLKYLEEIFPRLNKYFPNYAEKISDHLEEKITGDISRWVILKLAYLLHDFGKPQTHSREGKRSRFFGHEMAGTKLAQKILERLHFSNKERHLVTNVISNHMRPGNLTSLKEITDKAIYRYFRDLKDEALDTLVLSLADARTTEDTVISRKKQKIYPVDFKKHLRGVKEIIKRYYTRKKQIVPKNILNGDEIMKYFHLSEGPRIGQLIEMLKEAQAQKLVRTKKEAYKYLTSMKNKYETKKRD